MTAQLNNACPGSTCSGARYHDPDFRMLRRLLHNRNQPIPFQERIASSDMENCESQCRKLLNYLARVLKYRCRIAPRSTSDAAAAGTPRDPLDGGQWAERTLVVTAAGNAPTDYTVGRRGAKHGRAFQGRTQRQPIDVNRVHIVHTQFF